MNRTKIVQCATGVALASLLASCSTWNSMSQKEKGTAEGATGGAVVGAAVGGPVGAAVGAGVGGYAGHYEAKKLPGTGPSSASAPPQGGNATAATSSEASQSTGSNANTTTSPYSSERASPSTSPEADGQPSAAGEANSGVVRSAQQALNDKGYSISVDGVMGPNTENALRQFQQSQGLQQTGDLDTQTLSALGVNQ